jgi:hypothetical protein
VSGTNGQIWNSLRHIRRQPLQFVEPVRTENKLGKRQHVNFHRSKDDVHNANLPFGSHSKLLGTKTHHHEPTPAIITRKGDTSTFSLSSVPEGYVVATILHLSKRHRKLWISKKLRRGQDDDGDRLSCLFQ